MIEIEKPGKPGKGDEYFSINPQSSTVGQQIEKHLREGYRNRLFEISGKWPGNESDKEFEELLKDLD